MTLEAEKNIIIRGIHIGDDEEFGGNTNQILLQASSESAANGAANPNRAYLALNSSSNTWVNNRTTNKQETNS